MKKRILNVICATALIACAGVGVTSLMTSCGESNEPVKKTMTIAGDNKLAIGKTSQLSLKEGSETVSDATWSSSDDSIASVDNNGLVTAKKVGEAKITAKKDGYNDATYTITVAGKSMTIEEGNLTLAFGSTKTLTLKDDDGPVSGATWTSSAPTIVKVTDGVISCDDAGEATITAKKDGYGDASIKVTVTGLEMTASIDKTSIEAGETAQISATDSSSTPLTGLSFVSKDTSVATVASDGKVTGVSKGTATITVSKKGYNNKDVSISVTNKAMKVAEGSGISGGKINITAASGTISLIDVKDSTAVTATSYTSSKTDVATITNAGVVTPKALGETVITAKATGYEDITYNLSVVEEDSYEAINNLSLTEGTESTETYKVSGKIYAIGESNAAITNGTNVVLISGASLMTTGKYKIGQEIGVEGKVKKVNSINTFNAPTITVNSETSSISDPDSDFTFKTHDAFESYTEGLKTFNLKYTYKGGNSVSLYYATTVTNGVVQDSLDYDDFLNNNTLQVGKSKLQIKGCVIGVDGSSKKILLLNSVEFAPVVTEGLSFGGSDYKVVTSVGEKFKIDITRIPGESTDTIYFKSNDESKITVDDSGNVTVVELPGSTGVTISIDCGEAKTATFTVKSA